MVTEQVAKALEPFLSEFNVHITALIAIGVLTSILSFIINFMKLGASGDKPEGRSMAIRNLLISGICVSVFGSIGFFVWFLFSIVFG